MIKTNSKNSIKTSISGKSCTTNYILKSKVLGKSLRETGIWKMHIPSKPRNYNELSKRRHQYTLEFHKKDNYKKRRHQHTLEFHKKY